VLPHFDDVAETADGPVAIIHVFDARDGKEGTWTNALCRLAASAPFIELECRGPIIAPMSLQQKAREAPRRSAVEL
jgi:hypothetical protein